MLRINVNDAIVRYAVSGRNIRKFADYRQICLLQFVAYTFISVRGNSNLFSISVNETFGGFVEDSNYPKIEVLATEMKS